MIKITHLSKKFGRYEVLHDVSLEVGLGQVVALWGPNGAGKSTLVRCLLGLLPFTGTATIAGVDVRRRGKAARRLIGYVPQEAALFDDVRVDEAALFFGRLKRAKAKEVRQMLEEARLMPHARKRVRELSGGLKQRLCLGLARLTDPPVILLDEPTASLDAATRAELLSDIERLRESGKAVLLISHRPEEVNQLADRIVTLESGRIVRIDETHVHADGAADRPAGPSSAPAPGAGNDRPSGALSVGIA